MLLKDDGGFVYEFEDSIEKLIFWTRLENLALWELFLSKLLFLVLIFTILADETGRFSNFI